MKKCYEEFYRDVMEECIPSEEVRSYLNHVRVSVDTLREIISNSPISIERKIFLLKELSEKKDNNNNVMVTLDYYEDALEDLTLSKNQFFSVRVARYKNDPIYSAEVDSWEELIYDTSFEDVLHDIRARLSRIADTDEYNLNYYTIVEKKSTENRDRVIISYCLIGETIVAVNRRMTINPGAMRGRYEYMPPFPYKMGELVTVDCRPFMPIRHGLVLYSERVGSIDNTRIFYRDEKGIWRTMSYVDGLLQPFYKIEKWNGEPEGGDKLLKTVARYVGSDKKKWEDLLFGSKLWDYESIGYEISHVRDVDLLEYLIEQGLEMTENEQELINRSEVLFSYIVEKRLRFGDLYDVGVDEEKFPPKNTVCERMIGFSDNRIINDTHFKAFVICNEKNGRQEHVVLREENGEQTLMSTLLCRQEYHCIDTIFVQGYLFSLYRVEGKNIPPHLQVHMRDARYPSSEPGRAKSLEGAHFLLEDDRLYVVAGGKKYYYETPIKNGVLYYTGFPDGYTWLRNMTYYMCDEDKIEGIEKIRNWVT